MADVRASVAEFGADPSAFRSLDDERPELLPYATLLTARRDRNATLCIVEAVYEWQGAPLVFLVDADSVEDDDQLQLIRRLLAMRGDAPYLGVVAPGHLRVYRIALDSKSLRRARIGSQDWGQAKSTVFARLGNLRPEAAITNRGWISNVVLNLLSGSTTRLIDELKVSHEDAISLVGRALFTRFLADRSLLPAGMSEPGTAAGLFDTREVAEKTSDWLDTTFNGDLLPLSVGIFDLLPVQAYGVLGDVLRRAPDGQLFLGWEEKWGNLDFAHIPVGVLSQAYEHYLAKHKPSKQKLEGGYFTPRPIADLMVRASFRALERRDTGESVRVLDPAVGGGMFLLTAFRELVAERWRADGKRPDTRVLRRILYEQMVGFDINEAALRFAALGLYLLSIELDPNPRPVDKLRFERLRGTVLFRGTRADLGVVERIRAQGHPTLAAFWGEAIGVTGRGQLRGSGNGYQKLRTSSQRRRKGDGLPGEDASCLGGRLEITHTSFKRILVDHETLGAFSLDRVHRSRSPDLFAGPLVVVHKSLPAATGRIGVVVSDEGAIFNETFYGYSPRAHPDAAMFVRYLALVLGSKFVIWLALVTSGEFGFERDVIEKATLDHIPLPAFDKLGASRRREVAMLIDGLQSGAVTWEEVDAWVNDLYGLGKRDLQVILDTLEFSLPFAENKRNAQALPSSAEREQFCAVLRDELLPWCHRFGSTLAVDEIPPLAMSPWQALSVRAVRHEPTGSVPAGEWEGLLSTADEAAASEILVDNGPDGLLIARLAQRRYWSETQARLLAQRIAWSHVGALKGHATA